MVERKGFGTVKEMVDGVEWLFEVGDKETLERERQGLFKRYNRVLRAMGGSDFEVEHTGTKQRQKKGKLQSMVS